MPRYELVDNKGIVLGEVIAAEGVSMPQIGRALIGGRQPLHVREILPEPDTEAMKAAAAKAEAEAKAKAEAEAEAEAAKGSGKKGGGGSK